MFFYDKNLRFSYTELCCISYKCYCGVTPKSPFMRDTCNSKRNCQLWPECFVTEKRDIPMISVKHMLIFFLGCWFWTVFKLLDISRGVSILSILPWYESIDTNRDVLSIMIISYIIILSECRVTRERIGGWDWRKGSSVHFWNFRTNFIWRIITIVLQGNECNYYCITRKKIYVN